MATFGRQNNMRRRAFRPDTSANRTKRRGRLDQAMLLEIGSGGAPRRGVLSSLVGAIAGIFRRK